MMVKICGITCLDDALAAAEAGATALGFIFYQASPRYISPDRAAQIAANLPGGLLKVGVFVNEPAKRIASIAAQVPLDVVQLRGSTAPAGLRFWRMAGHNEDLPAPDGAEAVLLDTGVPGLFGGTGRVFPWELARQKDRRVIIAGGLDATNVAEAIHVANPWGVDACSRLESSPGRKDRNKMLAFIHSALAASV